MTAVEEIWKPVLGYGNYIISNYGRVKNRFTGHILADKVEKNGYVRVHLSNQGTAKLFLLHRLVACAFVPNPDNHPTVNHIDENKQNNRADNLEWCDMSYQNSYGVGAENRNKAKERPVVQFDLSWNKVKEWGSIAEAADALGLERSTIVAVCKGKRRYKSTGGYIFRYLEDVENN